MKRREFLKWASISGASALAYRYRPLLAAPRTPIDGESLQFIVFGDWGSGNSLQKNVARAMTRHCMAAQKAQKGIDFAISVGDNFYNDGVKNPADAQWETKFEAMYPAGSMPFPFYAVLGNHDWRLDPNAQIQYGQKPGTRWNMDGFFYARSMGGTKERPLAQFFFFDTDLWIPRYKSVGLGERQARWLDEALGKSTAKWKILVGHHPPFSDGEHALSSDLRFVREKIQPLIEKHKIDLMLSGHDHDMQHIRLQETPTQFAVIGAGGAYQRPRKTHNYGPFYQGMVGGFLGMDISGGQLRGRFIDINGNVLYKWEQKPRSS